jgi:aminoglycoside 6'-N-acetyltransferase I
MIARCSSVQQSGWLQLRQSLWPHCSAEQHLCEMLSFLAAPRRYVQYVAYTSDDRPIGFAEASLRTEYVAGTNSSPVAYLEGIYVAPEFRGKGTGAELVAVVSAWASDAGCSELASDAELENQDSHAFHRALGFEETARVVYFRKALGKP